MDSETGEMALLCPDERYPAGDSRGSNACLWDIKMVKPTLNRLCQDCYEFYSSHEKPTRHVELFLGNYYCDILLTCIHHTYFYISFL